jgi:cytidylate kinase
LLHSFPTRRSSDLYFNSAHLLVKTEAILRLYGLTLEEYKAFSTDELIKKVANVGSKLETYIEIKDVLDETTGKQRKAAQLTRLTTDLIALFNAEYVLIDRDGIETKCAFLPYKDQGDIIISEETALRVLHNRVALLSPGDKSRTSHDSYLITIDGQTASGKTTIAKNLAEQIGATWLEYSALYRAATLIVLEEGIPLDNKDMIISSILSKKIEIRLDGEKWRVFINGKDVFDKIYTNNPISKLVMAVPKIAEIPEIRQHMIPIMQRAVKEALSRNEIVVVTGHVAGKEVFPDADLKIFLEASLETRAIRLKDASQLQIDELQSLIQEKDSIDSQREMSSLGPAEDAILINTSKSSPEEVAQKIAQHLIAVRLSLKLQLGNRITGNTLALKSAI